MSPLPHVLRTHSVRGPNVPVPSLRPTQMVIRPFPWRYTIVPLVYWEALAGGWMLRSILVVWALVFLAIAACAWWGG